MVFDKTGGGVITWRELDQIMVALGFPQINAVTLKRAGIPESNAPSTGVFGLDFSNFLILLKSEELHNILDYSFNRHNAVYNIRVLKRAVQLLVDGHLELSSIRLARMAFSLYEGELCLGIPLEERSLMALMRLTGKVIAPKKLQEWIQKITVDIPNRVQLYEFFDIVRIADHREQVIKTISQPSSLSISKNKVGLFDVSDNSFLLTPEQKLLKKMDDDYDAYLSLLQTQQNPTKDHLEQRRNKTSGYKSVKILGEAPSEDESDDEAANEGKKGNGKEIVFDHIRESLRVGASNLVQVRTHLTSHPFPPSHSTRPHSVIGYINTKGGGGLGDSKRRSSTTSLGKQHSNSTFEERRSNNNDLDERGDDERIGESERTSAIYPTQQKIFGNLSGSNNNGGITGEELFEPMLEWPSFSTRRLNIPVDNDAVNSFINNTQSYEKEINRRRVRLPSLHPSSAQGKDSMTSTNNLSTFIPPPLPAHVRSDNLQRYKSNHISNSPSESFIDTIHNLASKDTADEEKPFKKTTS